MKERHRRVTWWDVLLLRTRLLRNALLRTSGWGWVALVAAIALLIATGFYSVLAGKLLARGVLSEEVLVEALSVFLLLAMVGAIRLGSHGYALLLVPGDQQALLLSGESPDRIVQVLRPVLALSGAGGVGILELIAAYGLAVGAGSPLMGLLGFVALWTFTDFVISVGVLVLLTTEKRVSRTVGGVVLILVVVTALSFVVGLFGGGGSPWVNLLPNHATAVVVVAAAMGRLTRTAWASFAYLALLAVGLHTACFAVKPRGHLIERLRLLGEREPYVEEIRHTHRFFRSGLLSHVLRMLLEQARSADLLGDTIASIGAFVVLLVVDLALGFFMVQPFTAPFQLRVVAYAVGTGGVAAILMVDWIRKEASRLWVVRVSGACTAYGVAVHVASFLRGLVAAVGVGAVSVLFGSKVALAAAMAVTMAAVIFAGPAVAAELVWQPKLPIDPRWFLLFATFAMLSAPAAYWAIAQPLYAQNLYLLTQRLLVAAIAHTGAFTLGIGWLVSRPEA